MKKTRLRAAPALVGVIASVTALGAGPALGASLSKCTTITKPGSYVLTRNLAAVGDCVVVAADFVTIDLGGWAITGDGTGGGITDQGAGRRGIAVRNGAITGFEVGISVGAKSIVSGINVDATDVGIFAGPGSTVSGNVVESGDSGISAGSGSIVSDNVVAESEFGLSGGPLSTVSGNTVAATDSAIFAGPGSTVSGNTAHADGFGGEVVDAFNVTCPSNVIGNTATGRLNLLGEGCTNIDNLVILP